MHTIKIADRDDAPFRQGLYRPCDRPNYLHGALIPSLWRGLMGSIVLNEDGPVVSYRPVFFYLPLIVDSFAGNLAREIHQNCINRRLNGSGSVLTIRVVNSLGGNTVPDRIMGCDIEYI